MVWLGKSVVNNLPNVCQEPVIRSEEEKQKLLRDLRLVQEKLAILELPHSDDQLTANEFSDQKLEPPADYETATDLHGNCGLMGVVINGIISLHSYFES